MEDAGCGWIRRTAGLGNERLEEGLQKEDYAAKVGKVIATGWRGRASSGGPEDRKAAALRLAVGKRELVERRRLSAEDRKVEMRTPGQEKSAKAS